MRCEWLYQCVHSRVDMQTHASHPSQPWPILWPLDLNTNVYLLWVSLCVCCLGLNYQHHIQLFPSLKERCVCLWVCRRIQRTFRPFCRTTDALVKLSCVMWLCRWDVVRLGGKYWSTRDHWWYLCHVMMTSRQPSTCSSYSAAAAAVGHGHGRLH